MNTHPLRPPFDAVLFDLDGTILDSGETICRAQAETCSAFGFPRTPDSMRRYLGPPLWQTFGEVSGGGPELVDAMVRDYRARYARLMPQTPAFEPVSAVIRRLHGAGLPLAVATSKLRTSALELLDLHHLTDCFVTVQGSGDDPASGAKAVVIGKALADLRAAGVPTEHLVLVGDRIHDIEGAAAYRIPTILVGWGYGNAEEQAAGAARVDSADQLERLLSGR